ncbi:MAG: hypothetical protein ABJ205_00500 [Erythrobacter sp.]|uniref:hypothetical protein n=1 Tax=Erythrobacter sp. TaxID=1042 RepID=UPI0032654D9E
MREDKRLNIAKRQLALAQIARREARFALANALAEEERSGQIHARAQDLLNEYTKRASQGDASLLSQTLQANLTFVRSLQVMAEDAQGAHSDAKDQAQWQMRALAAAETRMDTHEGRVTDEKRAMADLKSRRDIPPELAGLVGLARKLQNPKR